MNFDSYWRGVINEVAMNSAIANNNYELMETWVTDCKEADIIHFVTHAKLFIFVAIACIIKHIICMQSGQPHNDEWSVLILENFYTFVN